MCKATLKRMLATAVLCLVIFSSMVFLAACGDASTPNSSPDKPGGGTTPPGYSIITIFYDEVQNLLTP
jgi:hypothetical protein